MNIDDVTASTLTRLIESAVPERIDLEYKAEPYGRDDASKKELLKDVSAFANTQGGLLLIGVKERDGVPTALVPIEKEVAEKERERIQQILKDGLEPRLHGTDVECLAQDGGAVLAVRVRRSMSGPHRVSFAGQSKFWLRASSINYEANVMELRRLFSEGADLRERAERYHMDRLGQFDLGTGPRNLASGSRLLIHIIPPVAFQSSVNLDVREALTHSQMFRPIGAEGWSPRFVAEGFSNVRAGSVCNGYTTVGRDGIVEALKVGVDSQHPSGAQVLHGRRLESQIVPRLQGYVEGLVVLGVRPPFQIAVTIDGVEGAVLVGAGGYDDDLVSISEPTLTLPLATLEDVTSEAATAEAMRPAFDAFWNAGGYDGSPSYAGGAWQAVR